MKKIILLATLLCTMSCSTKVIDIKSPCVSTEEGPCGPKRSVNDWWIESKQIS